MTLVAERAGAGGSPDAGAVVPPRPDWRMAGLAGLLLLGGAAYVSGTVSGRFAALPPSRPPTS